MNPTSSHFFYADLQIKRKLEHHFVIVSTEIVDLYIINILHIFYKF